MSGLETKAKPFLSPLIRGAAIVLDASMRQTIAEWIVMKILTVEHNSFNGLPSDPIFEQPIRTAFMKTRAIPEGFRIWLGSQRGEKWSAGFHRHASGLGVANTFPPPPPPDPPIKNVQVITWGISRLLIYANATTDMRVYPFLEIDAVPLCRLWPLGTEDIVWPQKYFVTDAFMDNLADALEEFILSTSVIRQ